MEIKLEDYIHFYIGCEIIDVTKCQGTLSGTHGEYGPEVAYGTSEEPEYPGIENIKLILRKLSDMTEEDGIKLVGHQSPVYTYVEKVAASNHCFRFSFEYTSSRRRREWTIDYNRLNPEQFTYLLKQGFDLFGLIPAGLAIDKTSLKN